MPPVHIHSGLLCITFRLSVCPSIWVCESCLVHHLNGTGLHCAPLTCIVQHRLPWEVGVAPDIFHFMVFHMEHAQKGHFLSIDSEHTQEVHKGTGTEYGHSFVDNVNANQDSPCSSVTNVHFGGAQCSFALTGWCARRFCMFVISSYCDGTQYNVVSLAVCPSICLSVSLTTAWYICKQLLAISQLHCLRRVTMAGGLTSTSKCFIVTFG